MQTDKLLQKLWAEITSRKFNWMGDQLSVAYDTAFVASIQLPNREESPLFPGALKWLVENQHDDGSWGNQNWIFDQVLSTLISTGTLFKYKKFHKQAQNGLIWLKNHLSLIEIDDPENNPDEVLPAGFEHLIPSFISRLVFINPNIEFSLDIDKYLNLQKKKFEKIPLEYIFRYKQPQTFIMEFLIGFNDLKIPSLSHLLNSNGSLGNSPAATAWYIIKQYQFNPENNFDKNIDYLNRYQNKDGGFPHFMDYEYMVITYALYAIQSSMGKPLPLLFHPLIEKLYNVWTDNGLGFAKDFYSDSDTTSLAILLIHTNGISEDYSLFNAIEKFESKYRFLTYPYELGVSFLVNLHIYDLYQTLVDAPNRDRVLDKLKHFFSDILYKDHKFGKDKYYYSPILQNSHAILAFKENEPELSTICYNWLISQQKNGLWGMKHPTIEETAFAVMGICAYHIYVRKIDLSILNTAIDYITEHYSDLLNDTYWLAKVLFNPIQLQKVNVFSALNIYHRAMYGIDWLSSKLN